MTRIPSPKRQRGGVTKQAGLPLFLNRNLNPNLNLPFRSRSASRRFFTAQPISEE
jgi:hypothetical protein